MNFTVFIPKHYSNAVSLSLFEGVLSYVVGDALRAVFGQNKPGNEEILIFEAFVYNCEPISIRYRRNLKKTVIPN